VDNKDVIRALSDRADAALALVPWIVGAILVEVLFAASPAGPIADGQLGLGARLNAVRTTTVSALELSCTTNCLRISVSSAPSSPSFASTFAPALAPTPHDGIEFLAKLWLVLAVVPTNLAAKPALRFQVMDRRVLPSVEED